MRLEAKHSGNVTTRACEVSGLVKVGRMTTMSWGREVVWMCFVYGWGCHVEGMG